MSAPAMDTYDAVVVGAGPAGLSAALLLGRCRRQVLICDDGHPRNAMAHGLHGFLTRDGIRPAELLQIARQQLEPYDTVKSREARVIDASAVDGGFDLTLHDGTSIRCRKLLLATGVTDVLPPIPGFGDFYGRSAFHCPYCDGWEMRDQPIAVYGSGKEGTGLALELTIWSRDLVVCTNGGSLGA